jgi:hypothetical protein
MADPSTYPRSTYRNLKLARGPQYPARDDEAAARRHAELAAELDPAALYLLRELDLRGGDYKTARSRYASAFPTLLGKELPTFTARDATAALAYCFSAAGQEPSTWLTIVCVLPAVRLLSPK